MTPNQMRALADAPDVNHWSASARDSLRAAADEVDRLRFVMDNAPHAHGCMFPTLTYPTGKCTCWKANGL